MTMDTRGIAGTLVRHPNAAFGAVLFAVAAGIASNALLLQPSDHPMPFLSSDGPSKAVEATAGRPASESEEAADVVRAVAFDPLVAVVQTALARSAYGPLTADGVMGPATRDAIVRFQHDHDLPVTGEVSEALVLELRAYGALDDQ